MREAPLAAYGRGDEKGDGLALELTQWSHDIVLCSDGPSGSSASYLQRLARFGIELREQPITKLEGENAKLAILCSDGSSLERRCSSTPAEAKSLTSRPDERKRGSVHELHRRTGV